MILTGLNHKGEDTMNQEMDIQEVNQRFCHGDGINHEELNALLEYYTKAIEIIEVLDYRNEMDLFKRGLRERKQLLDRFKFYRERSE